MFKDPQPRSNRRRSRRQPPLAMALFCLVTSTCAVFATSPAGEARITACVPTVVLGMEEVSKSIRGTLADERGLADTAFNDASSR